MTPMTLQAEDRLLKMHEEFTELGLTIMMMGLGSHNWITQ
jgi:hypothetical protein